jgi:hypothetical protein
MLMLGTFVRIAGGGGGASDHALSRLADLAVESQKFSSRAEALNWLISHPNGHAFARLHKAAETTTKEQSMSTSLENFASLRSRPDLRHRLPTAERFSATGRYGMWGGRPEGKSLGLDAREPHHLGPLLGFFDDEYSELGRERRQPVELIERPAKFDPIVAQLD